MTTDPIPSVTQQGFSVRLLKSEAGGYNGGMVRINGELLLCTRIVRYAEENGSKRLVFKLAWQKPTGAPDGINMNLVHEIDLPGFPEDGHAEDPRVIRCPNGDLLICFVHATDDLKRPPCVRLARIRNGNSIQSAELLPIIKYEGNGTPDKQQKNWQFFYIGDHLYFIYWTYPHKVVEVNPDTGEVLGRWDAHDDKNFCWQWGPLSGGTPPVPWRGKMLSFYHGYMPHPVRRRRYYMGAYTFSQKPPFEIIDITPPLLRGSMNDPTNFEPPNHAGLPLVVFPCGLVPEEGDPDQMLVSMGVNDSYCALGSFDLRMLPFQPVSEMRFPKVFHFFSQDISIPLRASQIRSVPWTPTKQGFGGVIASDNPMVIDDCVTRGGVSEISKEMYDALVNGQAEKKEEIAPRMIDVPTGTVAKTLDIINTIINEISRLPGWSLTENNIVFASLVLAYRPEVVVEIGVYGGRSLISVALAMRAVGTGTIHGIDPWNPKDSIEGETENNAEWWGKLDHESIYRSFLSALDRFRVADIVQVHRKRSDAVDAPEGIGFLLIDGNHASQATVDVERFAPKVILGGFCYMDDLMWSGGNVSEGAAILTKRLGFKMLFRMGTGAMFQRISLC